MIQIENIRSFPKKSGVYLFKNKRNGKVYIGESKNMRARMSGHINNRSAENKKNHICRAIEKHGVDSFEFYTLEVYPNVMPKQFLLSREVFWIMFYDALSPNKGYNKILCAERREYPVVTFIPNKEQRQKMSERMMGNTRSKGRSHSEEDRRKIRENMREGHKKKLRPIYQIDMETGKIIKEWESCAHAARNLIGNPHSHTAIAKAARGAVGRKIAYGFFWKFKDGKVGPLVSCQPIVPIQQIDKLTGELIKEWPSIVEAAKFLESQGINARTSDISQAAKNEKKSAFGFKWKYIK